MKRKFLTLVVVLAFALPLIAACARSETPAPPDVETPPETETPAETEPEPVDVTPYVFIFPDSASQRIDEWTLYEHTVAELTMGQAEILARHCHIFQDPDLSKVFLHQDWYEERQNVTLNDLNAVEFYNYQLMEFGKARDGYRYFEDADNEYLRFPQGMPVAVDLNDDGQDETILFETDGRSYRLTVKDATVEMPYADAVADHFLLVRLTEGPEYTIVIQDDGPSSDYTSAFYRFDGTSLLHLGTLEGQVVEDLRINGNGTLKGYIRSAVLQTWWYDAEYVLDDDTILQVEKDVYETDWVLMVTESFPLYEDAALTKDAVSLPPGTIVRLTGTDNVSKVRLETLDGREGWFGLTGFHQILGTDATADNFFVGLNYAD